MPPQDRGLDGRTMPEEATLVVPGEMSLALDLLLLQLCVLLTRLAGRHDAARGGTARSVGRAPGPRGHRLGIFSRLIGSGDLRISRSLCPRDDANGYHALARKDPIEHQSGSQLVTELAWIDSELTILGDAKL
jgi:hypothetical protein